MARSWALASSEGGDLVLAGIVAASAVSLAEGVAPALEGGSSVGDIALSEGANVVFGAEEWVEEADVEEEVEEEEGEEASWEKESGVDEDEEGDIASWGYSTVWEVDARSDAALGEGGAQECASEARASHLPNG